MARDSAIARGGHLATLTSQEENDFVHTLVQATQQSLYLGGFQSASGAEPFDGWTWVTDEPWVFENWHFGEPNNGLNGPEEDYLMFFTIVPDVQSDWNDAGEALDGYVVEYESTPAAVSDPGAAEPLELAVGSNPLRGPTHVRFALPRAGQARITLHDVSGRRVATFLDAAIGAGEHQIPWAGRGADPLGAGMYFLRLTVGERARTVKVVVE